MKHRWAALMVVLALGALMPAHAGAQGTTPTPPAQRKPGFELGQNYPNPFNPTTTIPFAIGDVPDCAESGRQYRVSLKIYNVLAQLVAIPILQGGDGAGQPIVNVPLRCGTYTAYWDGTYLNTSQEVASGVYLYRLEVDGRAVVKKMIVMK